MIIHLWCRGGRILVRRQETVLFWFIFFVFFSHISLIRVGLLGVEASVGLDVLEGVVHQASVAAVVAVTAGAVNQLLLAQGHQLAGLLEGLTLQGAGLK